MFCKAAPEQQKNPAEQQTWVHLAIMMTSLSQVMLMEPCCANASSTGCLATAAATALAIWLSDPSNPVSPCTARPAVRLWHADEQGCGTLKTSLRHNDNGAELCSPVSLQSQTMPALPNHIDSPLAFAQATCLLAPCSMKASGTWGQKLMRQAAVSASHCATVWLAFALSGG